MEEEEKEEQGEKEEEKEKKRENWGGREGRGCVKGGKSDKTVPHCPLESHHETQIDFFCFGKD